MYIRRYIMGRRGRRILYPNLTRGTRNAPFAKIKAALLHLQWTKEKLTQIKESTSSLKSNSSCAKVLYVLYFKCLSYPRWIQMCTWFLINLLYSDKIRKTKRKITYTLYIMHCYFWVWFIWMWCVNYDFYFNLFYTIVC